MRLAKGITIEPAAGKDTQAIVSIFMANKHDPGLFQEPEARVRSNLRDFLVARDANNEVVACAGLHRDSDELAEIYGVAVLPALQGQGIGAVLMQKCKQQAAANQVTHLWLATVKPEYFRRYSFRPYHVGVCRHAFFCVSSDKSFSSRFNAGYPCSSADTPS